MRGRSVEEGHLAGVAAYDVHALGVSRVATLLLLLDILVDHEPTVCLVI